MSARGLVPQQVVIPFGQGLNQKVDPRAMQVGSLARCLDAAFTEIGGLQTRYPYASIGANIFGGGTVTECRRIVENGSELLLFTKTGLYSWSVTLGSWVLKGTHLAAKLDESSRFVTTGDQISADRAELSSTVVYCWTDNTTGYVAAVDKTTGTVLMAPTALAGAGLRLRLTALTTKIILSFYDNVGGIYCYALDPAAPATALAGASTTLSSAAVTQSAGPYYDIAKVPGADQAVYVVSEVSDTNYTIGTVTSGLTVARSAKVRNSSSVVAVSCEPTGTSAQVVRVDGSNIEGDLITISTLADVYIDQAIGTHGNPLNQIAAAHRSVTDSGVYRCYVFWSHDENAGSSALQSKYNWVSTGNTLGAEAAFIQRVGIASRAFDHEGRIFVWTVFAGESAFAGYGPQEFRAQLQNTYFLFRDDAFLVAKAAPAKAGGFSATTGHLPNVQSLGSSVYAWCGIERRIISLGANQSGYAARAPHDIKVTFDSNEARRCARLGQTLYVTGGEILQYDGNALAEVGFHIYPWWFAALETGTGNLTNGTYTYKVTWRWDNSQGDLDRSTTATTGEVTISGGPNGVEIATWWGLAVTHKTGIAVEVWRTAVNPPDGDAPFYLVTSKDPADSSNPNRYITNTTGSSSLDTFQDEFVDATATSKESHQENGGLLEYLAPPPATIIHATDDRLFLAGVAGDPHRIWYSRQRQDGEVASFHDALTVNVPRAGGDITAISVRDGVLYVWRETACYALPGDGFNNLGQGQSFGPARLISSDVGCVSMEALGATSTGFVFKSSKGWYTLEGASVQYIGDKISDYDSDTVYAVHVLEGQHQIRVLTSARMLTYDTNVQQWGEWSLSTGLHACLWNGTYHYLATATIYAEQTTHDATTYGMDIETAWIPIGQIQGFGRIWEVNILGQCQSAGWLKVRLYRNWNDTTPFQTKNWQINPTTVGGPMQIKHRPSIQEMQAIKIRITAMDMFDPEGLPEAYEVAPTNDVFKLSHLTLELGLERHLARLPAVQTQ